MDALIRLVAEAAAANLLEQKDGRNWETKVEELLTDGSLMVFDRAQSLSMQSHPHPSVVTQHRRDAANKTGVGCVYD